MMQTTKSITIHQDTHWGDPTGIFVGGFADDADGGWIGFDILAGMDGEEVEIIAMNKLGSTFPSVSLMNKL